MKPLLFPIVLAISCTASAQDRFTLLPTKNTHPGSITVQNDSNMTMKGDIVLAYNGDTFYCKSIKITNYLLTDLYGVRRVTSKGPVTQSDHLQVNDTNKWKGLFPPKYYPPK